MVQEPTLELHPIRLKVHLLADVSVPNRILPVHQIEVSSAATLKELQRAIVDSLSDTAPADTESRIWKVADGTPVNNELKYSVDLLKTWGATLIEPTDLTVEDEMIDTGDVFVVEYSSMGTWLIDPAEVSGEQGAQPSEPPALFNTDNDFFSQVQKKSALPTVVAPSTALKPSVTIKAGPSTTVRYKQPSIEPGTLGLGNM